MLAYFFVDERGVPLTVRGGMYGDKVASLVNVALQRGLTAAVQNYVEFRSACPMDQPTDRSS